MYNIIKIILAVTVLTACGPSPEEVEQNRINSQKTAKQNLANYVRKLDNVIEFDIMSDSSINSECLGGDGWATGKIVDASKQEHTMKCQTNGSSKGTAGCMTLVDFNTRYKDGECDKTIKEIPAVK